MLIVMKRTATDADVGAVVSRIEELGYQAHALPGGQRTAIGVVGNDGRLDRSRLSDLSGILEIFHVTKPYRRAALEARDERTIVRLPGVTFGGEEIPVIAGPCAVESESQIMALAVELREAGATMLRGGAYKPRTSPYAFQGIGESGLRFLRQAADATGLPIVTEAVDPDTVDAVEAYGDMIQIGSRNMQNYSLLKRAGKTKRPILLKRGAAATITEWLASAEYLLNAGNEQVVLCERGIRGFDPTTRHLLDLSAVPATKRLSHLPVIADPSHGTGVRDLVIPMARAALAAGADGIMVEVHPKPSEALSDGEQSLFPHQFRDLMGELRALAMLLGRRVTPTPQPIAT